MKLYSQRDSQWSGIKVGTGEQTIGQVGCTITCIGMAADLTPPEVNTRMNSVSGYTNGNLVTWTKVQAAIPWMQFEWRSPASEGYNNDRVKAAIEKNGFCLVEVDGSRIGGTKHWVLYIGNGQMYDPFYGTQKATSYYPATGYAIINKVGEPQSSQYRGYDLSNVDSMKVCVDDHIKIVEGQLVDKAQYESIKSTLTETQKQNTVLSSELGTCRSEKEALTKKIESLNNIVAEYQKEDAVQISDLRTAQDERDHYKTLLETTLWEYADTLKVVNGNDTLEDRIAAVETAIESLTNGNKAYEIKVKDLEKEIKRLNTYKKPIDSLSTGELLLTVVNRLFKRS